MLSRRTLLVLAAAGALALVIWGARKLLEPAKTEEQILLELVQRLGHAAEQRDARLLKAHIAKSYRDQQGRSKDDVGRLISLYFLRRGIINVYVVRSSVASINKAASPMTAQVTATTLLTRGPRVKKLGDLLPESARALRFDVDLEKDPQDGEWRAVSASWRNAGNVRDYIK